MQKYIDTVLDLKGNALAGASVYVYDQGTTTKSTIYSDDGVTAASNPLTTDSNGRFSFYAANGRYDLTVSGTGITSQSWTDIELYDQADGTTALTATTSLNSTDYVAVDQSGTAKKSLLSTIADWIIKTYSGFTQSGSAPTYGFSSRTVQAKLAEGQLSITDFKNSDGTAVSTSVSDNSTGLQSAITYCFTNGIELIGPVGEFTYSTALTLPDTAGVFRMRGLGRPKSFTGGTDGDPSAVRGFQLTYQGATGDAFGGTLTGSKRQYITLDNLTIQGNSSGTSGHGISWNTSSTTCGFLVCYRDVTVNGAKQHGIYHNGAVFESELNNVRCSQNGDRGFKAAANGSAVPGETVITASSFNRNAVGVDLSGGGHFTYTRLTASYNSSEGIIATGIDLDGVGLQLESNGSSSGAQGTLTLQGANLSGITMTCLTSGTGTGLNFTGTGYFNRISGYRTNSSVTGSGYKDFKFADTVTRCTVEDYKTDDATDRYDLGQGGGHVVRRGSAYATGQPHSQQTITLSSAGSTATPDAIQYDSIRVVITATGAQTIADPTTSTSGTQRHVGQILTFEIYNFSGGTTTITWGSGYIMEAWTDPANTKRQTRQFFWNNSKWVQVGAGTGDM